MRERERERERQRERHNIRRKKQQRENTAFCMNIFQFCSLTRLRSNCILVEDQPTPRFLFLHQALGHLGEMADSRDKGIKGQLCLEDNVIASKKISEE
jgi:hypothetical protein